MKIPVCSPINYAQETIKMRYWVYRLKGNDEGEILLWSRSDRKAIQVYTRGIFLLPCIPRIVLWNGSLPHGISRSFPVYTQARWKISRQPSG
jgi:hypothetical protein